MTPLLPAGLHFWERGWLSSNSILLDDGHSCVVIDSGYVTHASTLISLLCDFLKNRSVDLLVNTHLHSDHCGGNSAVQSHFLDVKTLIPFGLLYSVFKSLFLLYNFSHTSNSTFVNIEPLETISTFTSFSASIFGAETCVVILDVSSVLFV